MTPADLAPGNTARPTSQKKKVDLAKRLSDSEEDDLLLGVVNRASDKMQEDRSRPLPFPVDVLPESLKRLVLECSTALPCPTDYIGLPMLAVVGSFVGTGRPLQVKQGWEERAVIYGAVVGHTGSRKSPAMERAMAPARRRDQRLAAEYKIAKKEYCADQAEARRKKTEFTGPPPVARQHLTTDTTVEALADVLQSNPRGLLVYRDELTALVASLNQYKGGKGSDKQFWLSNWSCQDFAVNRKGREPLRILRPFLSVIGNIPPDMLGELVDRRGREDGFIDRILFAFPDPVKVKWTDVSPDSQLEKAYVDACLRIGKLPDTVLTLMSSARAEFAVWYDEHNRSHDGPAGSWAKMDGYCARLASIIHHLRWAYGEIESPDEVDVDSVRRAIKLIAYFKNHAVRALGRMKSSREEKSLARLLAFVANAPAHRVHPRTLIAAQIAANAPQAKAMLERLASMGLGEMTKGRRKDEIVFQGRDNLEDMVDQFEERKSG